MRLFADGLPPVDSTADAKANVSFVLFAEGLPPVDSTVCPSKALLAGEKTEIMLFCVRSERNVDRNASGYELTF